MSKFGIGQPVRRVEDLRGIAVMRPTEANVRRYMELEAKVVAQASTFADVAQRVAWTMPELDPSLQGRPVNAKALEVFEAQQMGDRSRSIASWTLRAFESAAAPSTCASAL